VNRLAQAIHSRFDDDERRRKAAIDATRSELEALFGRLDRQSTELRRQLERTAVGFGELKVEQAEIRGLAEEVLRKGYALYELPLPRFLPRGLGSRSTNCPPERLIVASSASRESLAAAMK
jgi:hypothetical protein